MVDKLTHLKQLEAESIHIIREVAAEFDNPVTVSYTHLTLPTSDLV